MNNTRFTTRRLVICAVIAAIYAAASLALPVLAFGSLQFRFSEALTLLPVLMPDAVIGVSVGCAVSNLIGALTGLNPLGLPDAVIGTCATFLAAICSMKLGRVRWRGLPVLSALPPVLFNALFLGAEFTFLYGGGLAAFLVFAAQIALPEAVATFVLGLLMIRALERSGVAAWLGKEQGLSRPSSL